MKQRPALIAVLVVCAGALVALLGTRAWVDGDLYFKDQPKTLSYTADVVLHGRLALPRDGLHQPASKPPLVNWIGGLLVLGTGSWSPLVLKLPSLLAALGTIGVLFVTTRRLLGAGAMAVAAAALGSFLWLDNRTAFDLAGRVRPDMLQAFCLTLAWSAATLLLYPQAATDELKRKSFGLAALFWFAVAMAALTKGPMALLAVAYGLLLPFVLGRPRDVWRLRPLIGLPLALLPVGLWLLAAWLEDARHVREVLLGAEVLDRIATETPEGHVKPWWQGFEWFASKTYAWFYFTLLATLLVAGRSLQRRRVHPMVPAALWLVVLLVGISLSAGKRIDYVLPAMMPGGVLAGWLLAVVAWRAADRVPKVGVMLCVLPALAALGYGGLVARNSVTRSVENKTDWTSEAVDFAREARQIVGDGELIFLARGKTPMPTLLGVHHGDGVTDEQLSAADYVVMEAIDGPEALLASPPLPVDFAPGLASETAEHALYRRDDLSDDDVRSARQNAMTWTVGENPYRSEANFPSGWDE